MMGLFAVARRLTGDRLRILCYHGLSVTDEHLYSPGLFMKAETVRSRFDILVRGAYPVLHLDEAFERLRAGGLPRSAVVITYDDGFYGNFVHSPSWHGDGRLPATIYVTTYYVAHQNPIFRHAVRYMFWKTKAAEVSFADLPGLDAGGEALSLSDLDRGDAAQWRLIRHAETHLDENGRVELARELGRRLGVDYDELAGCRGLGLMTPDEIGALSRMGLDIQLHTHRHHMPLDEALLRREIEDNRAVLEPIVGRPCDHLCYPSGVFHSEQMPWLEACGIKTATTCENGLNDAQTPPYRLRRFLDGESVRPIEFEAEISGFAELVRRLGSLFGRGASQRAPGSNQGH
jgi:peptidoglycan/xylan/chitin deacetylase (PgdA/CDA1 family)